MNLENYVCESPMFTESFVKSFWIKIIGNNTWRWSSKMQNRTFKYTITFGIPNVIPLINGRWEGGIFEKNQVLCLGETD